MAKLSTGLDIVSVSRIKRASRHPRFLVRICTDKELEHASALSAPYRFYALLFAAKEAAAKALGTGIGRGFGFTDIEVSVNKKDKASNGFERALLRFHNRAAIELGDRYAFLSCSLSGDLAAARVLIVGR